MRFLHQNFTDIYNFFINRDFIYILYINRKRRLSALIETDSMVDVTGTGGRRDRFLLRFFFFLSFWMANISLQMEKLCWVRIWHSFLQKFPGNFISKSIQTFFKMHGAPNKLTWSFSNMNILIHRHYCTSILYTQMDIRLYYHSLKFHRDLCHVCLEKFQFESYWMTF